jgi:hypothetical protein
MRSTGTFWIAMPVRFARHPRMAMPKGCSSGSIRSRVRLVSGIAVFDEL